MQLTANSVGMRILTIKNTNMFFKRRFTKWLPILIYDFSGSKFLLQGRKNLKTGELCFKNTLMNGRWNLMHNMPQNIFEPKEQLERLLTYSDSV